MMLSAIAYNLKKYLRFSKNLSKSIAKTKTLFIDDYIFNKDVLYVFIKNFNLIN